MAETEKRMFKPGDFLTKFNKKGSFMIYEGNDLSQSTYKRITVVCSYDPEKYVMGDMGYEQKPELMVGSPTKACSDTLDTDREDYWIHFCTEQEKAQAIEILKKYHLAWNAETLELVDIDTGEVVRKVTLPDNKYYGQVIKPISEDLKSLIKKCCISKLTPAYPTTYYDYYDD